MTAIINFNSISGVSTISANTKINVGGAFLQNNAVGLGTTDTTGRNAGISTAIGTLIYNTTANQVQGYGPQGWVSIKTLELLAATGGTTSTTARSGYTVHTFTGDGTFTVTSGSGLIEYFVVAGGGGGAAGCGANPCAGGGGGAGGLRYSNSFPVSPGPYTVTIGPGGPNGAEPRSGTDSVFGTITSDGGGGAGSSSSGSTQPPGESGGSGGGSSSSQGPAPGAPATGDPGGTDNSVSPANGWGNDGGGGITNNNGAGGGGAGAAGGDSNAWPGNGGAGLSYTISGTSVTYAVGGPGGEYNTTTPGPAGTANRGNGGWGGGGSPSGNGGGGNGGSGIVIIAYPNG